MHGRYARADTPPPEKAPGWLRPRRLALTLCLILLFGGGGAAFFYTALHQPPRVFHIPLPGGSDADAVARSQGHKSIEGLLEDGRAGFSCAMGADNTPIFTLILDDGNDWSRQAAYVQKSMCLYLQWLIPQARVLPSSFIPQGRDNPRYEENARAMGALCSSCWAIADGGGRFFVAGDRAWESLANKTGVETLADLRRRAEGN